jgi:hypothetical protein
MLDPGDVRYMEPAQVHRWDHMSAQGYVLQVVRFRVANAKIVRKTYADLRGL